MPRFRAALVLATPALAILVACGGPSDREPDIPVQPVVTDAPEPALTQPETPAIDVPEAGPTAFTWPASLAPFGDGYLDADDPCRRVGESAAMAEHLDHERDLVGCPGDWESRAVLDLMQRRNAEIVGEVDGVTLVSVERS
ncbi:hypothetical protein [uncultured Algimonas sp.]|uniref:hypothetical protein n=1 Tax=uncultured Algimonas sp. TaxID=1547920 RepID=UPI002605B4C3|nr:hypothetical protein [uncultured Algimonas sp.]